MTAKDKMLIKRKPMKAQSLIEYVLTMTVILIIIVGGTIGFHRGVQSSVDTYQRSVNATVTNTNPFLLHSDRLNDPTVVGKNPTAPHEAYIKYQDEDTGGPSQRPEVQEPEAQDE
jgi:hypothetical protein